MIRVTKGNKELRVDDHYEKEYLEKGWDVIDNKGKVLKHGLGKNEKSAKQIEKLKSDLKKSQEALAESEKENDALVAKIQELEKELTELKAATK